MQRDYLITTSTGYAFHMKAAGVEELYLKLHTAHVDYSTILDVALGTYLNTKNILSFDIGDIVITKDYLPALDGIPHIVIYSGERYTFIASLYLAYLPQDVKPDGISDSRPKINYMSVMGMGILSDYIIKLGHIGENNPFFVHLDTELIDFKKDVRAIISRLDHQNDDVYINTEFNN